MQRQKIIRKKNVVRTMAITSLERNSEDIDPQNIKWLFMHLSHLEKSPSLPYAIAKALGLAQQ